MPLGGGAKKTLKKKRENKKIQSTYYTYQRMYQFDFFLA